MLPQHSLASGGVVRVKDAGAVVELDTGDDAIGWTFLSSAVWKGGWQTLGRRSSVMNVRTSVDYDGLHPPPEELLKEMARAEGLASESTVGLLTAASMVTLVVTTRSADGMVVDAVVTAGISNTRMVGAAADYFGRAKEEPRPSGTINTIVVINGVLPDSTLVEAHALAVEAKCRACNDLSILCTKTTQLAQGTGTDVTAVVCRHGTGRTVDHAGKHTLLGEMIGQAVHEATREALLINIRYLYGDRVRYGILCWQRRMLHALGGSRPCVPSMPGAGVPWPPPSVIFLGIIAVTFAYLAPLSRSASVLLAAVSWDRFLGLPPLAVHPVILVGRLISAAVHRTADKVFHNPLLGFLSGTMLVLTTLALSLSTAWLLLSGVTILAENVETRVQHLPGERLLVPVFPVINWLIEVLIVNSALSLQLLCSVALQMSRFLERRQIAEARIQLCWLCSRDAAHLGAEDLAAGTLESLAENLSDAFVGGLMWYAVGGPFGALAYKVVNTLDSRVGKRGKFEWYGKFAARLDDLLNLLPARVTALFLIVAAWTTKGCNARKGAVVAWRDATRTLSPNGGWPMACLAGLLGVQLDKKGEYSLGRPGPLPGAADIGRGVCVVERAGLMAAAVAIILTEYRSSTCPSPS